MKFIIPLFLAVMAAIPTAFAEANAPDAMQHMVVAPEIDLANLRDPFESYLKIVAARNRAAQEERLARKNARAPELLENFDLDTLKLVAVFSMGEEQVAMVEDAQGKGHLVGTGSYMGKNNGRVEKLTDDTIFLIEQVVDPAGDLVNRQVTLTLKEVNE